MKQTGLCVLSGASVCCHCHVTRPSDRFVRSSWETERWIRKGPAGVDVNVAAALLLSRIRGFVYTCVFLH